MMQMKKRISNIIEIIVLYYNVYKFRKWLSSQISCKVSIYKKPYKGHNHIGKYDSYDPYRYHVRLDIIILDFGFGELTLEVEGCNLDDLIRSYVNECHYLTNKRGSIDGYFGLHRSKNMEWLEKLIVDLEEDERRKQLEKINNTDMPLECKLDTLIIGECRGEEEHKANLQTAKNTHIDLYKGYVN